MKNAITIPDETKMRMNERSRALADLAVCPSELSVVDPNASVLWVKFLRPHPPLDPRHPADESAARIG